MSHTSRKVFYYLTQIFDSHTDLTNLAKASRFALAAIRAKILGKAGTRECNDTCFCVFRDTTYRVGVR